MAQAPTTPQPSEPESTQRGVFLNVDDIERLSKAYQGSVKADAEAKGKGGSCGVIVCGNGAAI
jgi:hypothetical protein